MKKIIPRTELLSDLEIRGLVWDVENAEPAQICYNAEAALGLNAFAASLLERVKIAETELKLERELRDPALQKFLDDRQQLIASVEQLERELAVLKDPSDGRCMEIVALRQHNEELIRRAKVTERESPKALGLLLESANADISKLRSQNLALAGHVQHFRKGLESAIYDLERIRDADWTADQMRLGAKSGAYHAKQFLSAPSHSERKGL